MGRTFYVVRFTMKIKLWSVFPRSHLSRWAGNRIFLVSSDEETWWPDAGIEGHGEVDESSLAHRTLIHILILTVGRLHKQFHNCWVLPVTTWAFLQFIGSTDTKLVGRWKRRSISAKTTADSWTADYRPNNPIFAPKTIGRWSFLEMWLEYYLSQILKLPNSRGCNYILINVHYFNYL